MIRQTRQSVGHGEESESVGDEKSTVDGVAANRRRSTGARRGIPVFTRGLLNHNSQY